MFAEVPKFLVPVGFVWRLAMAGFGFTLYPFQTEAGSGYCLWEYRLGARKKKSPVLFSNLAYI